MYAHAPQVTCRSVSNKSAMVECHQNNNNVEGVMKMGNIVPRAGIEPISLTCQASLLHHISSLMSPLCPCLSAYAAPCLRGQCSLLHPSPWNCKPFNTYYYIHLGNGLIYTYTGQAQQPYSTQLIQDPGHGLNVEGVMKMGNIVPRVGLKPTSPAFQASVLPFHHICSHMSPRYPRLPSLCSCLPERSVQ